MSKQSKSLGIFVLMGIGLGLTSSTGDIGNIGRIICIIAFCTVAFFPHQFVWLGDKEN